MDNKRELHVFLGFDKIPRTTAQQKKIAVIKGRPIVRDSEKLKLTKRLYRLKLDQYKPDSPFVGALELGVVYHFERPGNVKKSQVYKITRPDTDNLIKALKDCMAESGYFLDDAQVVVTHIKKVYAVGNVGIEIFLKEI
ncbi:RusA family crossover junction endodeoxyribonuclease [Gemella sp. zg-1178]|uniref:RusA family crossover junction endodeoxyribonuclease n=1 Tax=Gemella sp. zg-1178 TaxID=2840372 RepID=UPI001C03E6A0|nr:RusA family crossover junction endodeoxyribonuclease [Gemella sp. zg-1178]MBU0279284.1 RusA family crossover junction endodeoxyribonuclease [Gemella sp. zg-1178]